jgi:hypothetical protein
MAATAFANSKDLKSTMMKAGVIGASEFWFGEDLERTSNLCWLAATENGSWYTSRRLFD